MANTKNTEAKKNNKSKSVTSNSTTKSKPKSNTTTKKTTSKKTSVKKTGQKKQIDKTQTKSVNIKTNRDKDFEIKGVELVNVLENDDNIVKKENKFIEEINKVENIEAPKTIKKNNKKMIFVGIIISLLGIIALFLSLVANRTIDREFLSDTTIILMMVGSILIEVFGAFIIINES